MRQNPGKFLPVIELMYLCLSLGFQGRYRLSPRGPAELDRLREETYAVIVRQRQPAEPDLSPHWAGVAAPYRPVRASVPLWVGASAGLAVLAALFIWFSTSLGRGLRRRVCRDAERAADPYAADRPRRRRSSRRRRRSCPSRRSSTASARCSSRKSTRGWSACAAAPPPRPSAFATAACSPRAARRSSRNSPVCSTASAGRSRTKRVQCEIIGYTDNQPIHTVQFASNFQLSAARADAAMAVIAAVDRRSRAGPRRRPRRGRSDRLQRHAGGSRRKPADRDHPDAAGLIGRALR